MKKKLALIMTMSLLLTSLSPVNAAGAEVIEIAQEENLSDSFTEDSEDPENEAVEDPGYEITEDPENELAEDTGMAAGIDLSGADDAASEDLTLSEEDLSGLIEDEDSDSGMFSEIYISESVPAGDAGDGRGRAGHGELLLSAASESDGSEYYGSQLSGNQKAMYESLKAGNWALGEADSAGDIPYTIAYSSQTDYSFELESKDYALSDVYKSMRDELYSDAFTAFDAYLYDYPEDSFWIRRSGFGYSISYYQDASTGIYHFSLINMHLNAYERWTGAYERLADMRSYTENSAAQIQVVDGYAAMTTGEKLKAVHDHICNLVSYGDASNVIEAQHTPYGAYDSDHKVVCEGYSKLFKILVDKLGIADNILVSGTAYDSDGSGGAHMWNVVSLEGSWYLLDATWDDQDKSSTVYYDYFLAGSGSYGFSDYWTVGEQHEAHASLSNGGEEFTTPTLSGVMYHQRKEIHVTATCTQAGSATIVCGLHPKMAEGRETTEETVTIPARGHDYGNPVWEWAEDYSSAAVTLTCSNDSTHTVTLTATATSEVTQEASYAEPGVRTYTAAVQFNGNEYQDQKTEEIPVLSQNGEEDEISASGIWPTGGSWSLTKGGTLTVSGSGVLNPCYEVNSHKTEIKELRIREGITGINTGVTLNYPNMETVYLPESFTWTTSSLFQGCTALKEAHIESNINLLPTSTFAGCSALETVELPESLRSVQMNAFSGCRSLQSIDLKNSNRIETAAFTGCTSLREVTFGYSSPMIAEKAFLTCSALEQVTGIQNPEDWVSQKMVGALNGPLLKAMDYPIHAGGSYGDGLTWEVKKTCLSISGSGVLYAAVEDNTVNYPASAQVVLDGETIAPWGRYHDVIDSVVIGEGITQIHDNAFYCNYDTSVYPAPINTITFERSAPAEGFGENAFAGLNGVTIHINGCEESWTEEICQSYGGTQIVWDPVGHSLSHVEEIAATCEGAGNIEYWKCERCGKCFRDAEGTTAIEESAAVVAAKGHAWGEGFLTTQPTCTEAGEKTFTCKNNPAHTRTEPIEALGHDLAYIEANAATCEEAGNIEYWKCERCGKCFQDAEGAAAIEESATAVAATGHAWGEGFLTTQPTCTEAGEKTFTCKNNPAHTRTEPIEALGHDLAYIEANAATCEEAGNIAYWKCERCGKCFRDAEGTAAIEESKTLVAAAGHAWGEVTYTWADDYSSVTAERICCRDYTHVENETVTTVSEITKQPNCENKGETTYTAVFTNTAFITQAKTLQNLDLTGHDYGNPAWEWAEDYTSAAVTLTCSKDTTHKETLEAAVTSEITQEASYTTPGERIYTAAVQFNGNEYQDKKTEEIPVLSPSGVTAEGLSWKVADGVLKVSLAEDARSTEIPDYAAAEDAPWAKAVAELSVSKADVKEGITKIGSNSFAGMESLAEINLPQSLEKLAEDCIDSSVLSTVHVNYAGTESHWEALTQGTALQDANMTSTHEHRWGNWHSKIPATCTEDAVLERECDTCHETQTMADENTATGHDYGDREPDWKWKEDYTAAAVFTCKHDATHKETLEAAVTSEITQEASYTTPGERIYTAAVQYNGNEYQDWKTKEIPKLSPSGVTDEGLSWEIADGVLTVSLAEEARSTEIPDYTAAGDAPWGRAVAELSVSKIVVEEGITKVGSNSFAGMESLDEINLPQSLEEFADNSVEDTVLSTVNVNYAGSQSQWEALTRGTALQDVNMTSTHVHTWDAGKITRAATTASAGAKTYTCACGETKTESIPKLKAAPKAAEKITIFKKLTIKKPSAAKGKITVKWKHFKHTSKKTKKIWKPIKSVQIQCATDSGFRNIVKTATAKKSKTSAKIKGLKRKTTYYVRVRYFDGRGYSAWSKVKKVKTK